MYLFFTPSVLFFDFLAHSSSPFAQPSLKSAVAFCAVLLIPPAISEIISSIPPGAFHHCCICCTESKKVSITTFPESAIKSLQDLSVPAISFPTDNPRLATVITIVIGNAYVPNPILLNPSPVRTGAKASSSPPFPVWVSSKSPLPANPTPAILPFVVLGKPPFPVVPVLGNPPVPSAPFITSSSVPESPVSLASPNPATMVALKGSSLNQPHRASVNAFPNDTANLVKSHATAAQSILAKKSPMPCPTLTQSTLLSAVTIVSAKPEIVVLMLLPSACHPVNPVLESTLFIESKNPFIPSAILIPRLDHILLFETRM